ncbi:hypothetical protein OG883_20265 [Streptomyces sp. NBC_01142]|uniref:hypothetical protein n=1 Tax=Streptomyces sp. NBC_01142 TaxID=2975865 RepID=UPI00225A2F92|nr:hypothetical protein [Streptomyces sp. NBC_01142]MCX4822178.1 hypothetical protein [Streptomyces sp. NBC_01142]
MRPKAQHYSILVVDIEKFGRRANPVQLWLRERLYALVESAFEESGIDHHSGPQPSDRGDGFFWLLPGTVDKTDLTGRYVELLHQRLREHARTSSEEGAMRLRVALHHGDVARDERGWVGEELNTACRLADIAPLRAALTAAQRAGLALAVSADWYRQVVRHDDPSVACETFRRAPFDAKEIQGAHAWIRVPGYDAPPGVPDPGVPDPGDAASAASAGAPERPAGTDRAGEDASGPFAGAHFDRVGQVFGGDQVVYGPQTFRFGEGGDS